MFEDNGHDRKMIEKIVAEYKPRDPNEKRDKNQNRKQNKNSQPDNTENLFDVLPFRDIDLSECEEEKKPYIVMTYLPDGLYHQMKRACNKAGVQLITRPGTKLKDLLCAPNRTHHDPLKKLGVYKIQCPPTQREM